MKNITFKLTAILFIVVFATISFSCSDDGNGCDDGDRECLITGTWKTTSTYQRVISVSEEGNNEVSSETINTSSLDQYLKFDSDGSFQYNGKFEGAFSGTWEFTADGLKMSYTSGLNTPYVTNPVIATLNSNTLELKYLESYNGDRYLRTTITTYKR